MLKRALLVLSVAMAPLPALADWDHGRGDWDRGHHDRHGGGWDRHYSHGPRTRVSFNFGVAPYYARPYYYPPRVVYAVPPVAPAPDVVYINNDNSQVVDLRNGRYCREYQSHVRVGGTMQESYGTACRNPDGSWEIVS